MDHLRSVLDRFEIQDALMRYARGVDRLDAQLITSAYHPDAQDYRGGALSFTGAESGDSLVGRLRDSCDVSVHSISNVLIEIDGDTAWCESYFRVSQSKAAADGTRHLHVCGRYIDRFERRETGWKIARRDAVTDWSNSYLLDENNQAPFPVSGVRSHDDLSYRR